MATKNGLRVYDEKPSGKSKYRIVMDYFHPYENRWKQVSCKSNSTTKTALDEAKNKLSQKVNQILGEVNKKKSHLTVAEAFEDWLQFRKPAVAESTYRKIVSDLRGFKQQFGRWQVSKMEKEHLKDYLMTLEVCPASLVNYRSKLNLFFQYCEDEGYIDENPMCRVRLPQHKETLEERQKREDKYFTVDEMCLLLQAMEKRPSRGRLNAKNDWRKRLLVEFQFSIGDRISESTGFRYQDIDFEAHTLHLRAQYDVSSSTKAPRIKNLKTDYTERFLRLKTRELEILEWFKTHNHTNSPFIFVQENGNVMTFGLLNHYLQKFREVLPHKLESSFVTHALRHGNVMFKKELGIDEQIIGRDGGWSDTQMITKVYGRHISPNLRHYADQTLENFSVENSQKIHKKSEEKRGTRRKVE